MQCCGRRVVPALLLVVLCLEPAAAQLGSPSSVFRSNVDVVSVTAVVRDGRGRVVSSLTRDDFEVVDSGRRRSILHLQAEVSAPVSLALLVDGSGSMGLGMAPSLVRRISDAVLLALNHQQDEAALFSFDTRLVALRDFSGDIAAVRSGLHHVDAWGSTSLYDAIAGTAGLLARHAQNRRAVVVLTDGRDNASDFSPKEVAWIAGAIDVPVYIFSLSRQHGYDRERAGRAADRLDALKALAHATGGELFEAHTHALAGAGIKTLLEELRHQYVIAFEAGAGTGLRRMLIRSQRKGLTVRSRSYYVAGNGEDDSTRHAPP
jgi:Ca-activated chloride channel homolog